MEVGINKLIDAPIQLGAIHHCTTYFRVFLFDSIERATVDLKREFCFVKWTNQCSEGQFLINVDLDIFFKQTSALEIPFGALGVRRFREGQIPSVDKLFVDFVGIKITGKCPFPSVSGEGRELERLSESIHVRGKPGLIQASLDPVHMVLLEVRAGSSGEIVTFTISERECSVVGFVESGPKSFVNVKIVDTSQAL